MQPYRPVLACLVLATILSIPAMPIAMAQPCVTTTCVPVGGALLQPEITITATDTRGSEINGFESLTFRIDRDDDLSGAQQVVVKLKYTGEAQRNLDFTGDESVTIPAGQTSVTLTVTPMADNLHTEGLENVIVRIVFPTEDTSVSYTVGDPGSAEGTITNVPPSEVSVEATDTVAAEGGLDNGRFVVTRGDPSAGPLSVNLEVLGAVAGSDYVSNPTLSTVLVFNSGQTRATFDISMPEDAAPESSKPLTLRVKESTAGTTETTYRVSSAKSVATINLLDTDLPTVSLNVLDGAAAEGVTADTATIRFTRAGTTGTLTVGFSMTGSAVDEQDFSLFKVTTAGTTETEDPIASSITIASGQTSATVRLRAIDDSVAEGQESVLFTLIGGAAAGFNAAPGAGSGQVTIQDNDVTAVTVTASKTRPVEAESFNLVFTRSGANSGTTASPLDVAIDAGSLTGFTSTASTDLRITDSDVIRTTTSTFVRFGTGAAQVSVVVQVVDDNHFEETESTSFAIIASSASPPAYGLGTPSSVAISIVDNDIVDADADGVHDPSDNCPGVANPPVNGIQPNADGDSQGDACDTDDDNDGLSDTQEAALGTNPRAIDTDGDARSDKEEVDAGSDPRNTFSPEYRPAAASIRVEAAGDGVSVSWTAPAGSKVSRYLVFRASDPVLVATVPGTSSTTSYTAKDTAFPGGNHTYYVQPMLPSQTGDAFNATRAVASEEVDIPLCEAFATDTDDDGLCDRDEEGRGTDPTEADTDGDGIEDGAEVDAGSDPVEVGDESGSEVALSRETPFWIGLVLAVATLVGLVVGIGMSRRGRSPPTDGFGP